MESLRLFQKTEPPKTFKLPLSRTRLVENGKLEAVLARNMTKNTSSY